MHYNKVRGSLGFWRTSSGSEVDFIWWYGTTAVGMEVKRSRSFQQSYLKGLKSLGEALNLRKSFVIYLGDEQLKAGDTQVLPINDFLIYNQYISLKFRKIFMP